VAISTGLTTKRKGRAWALTIKKRHQSRGVVTKRNRSSEVHDKEKESINYHRKGQEGVISSKDDRTSAGWAKLYAVKTPERKGKKTYSTT